MSEPGEAIGEVIRADWKRVVPDSAIAVGDMLRRKHGPAVGAVLFYGSCLRSKSDRDSLLDLYLLVDSYRDCYPGRSWAAWANRALPPNVYYFEQTWADYIVRTKYAVISFDDFALGASRAAKLPAIWARFSQPTVLVHARDEAAERVVESALIDSVTTMAMRTAPLINDPVDAMEFWTTGYARSYRAEARVEGAGRATELVEPKARYEALFRPALLVSGIPFSQADHGRIRIELSDRERRRGRAFWARASVAARLHTVPRLAKAAVTFEGGVDYAIWKVERHSGVKVEASPWQRRHPILAAVPLLWCAWRRGAFRRVRGSAPNMLGGQGP
ncbi:MAG TPA: hypothetical protein VED46_06415 [Alphaproteobacteria bacterium]|nr:hypothetical protein [Alphaproteobacteria bacterium]